MSNEGNDFEQAREQLVDRVKEILTEYPLGLKEHQLIQILARQGVFDAFANQSASHQLFSKHFLTKHILYSLQEILPREQSLHIDPVLIRLYTSVDAPSQALSEAGRARLASYYLDLTNLHSASEESVDYLLNGFWQRFAEWSNGDAPFETLELNAQASWPEVQKAYRKKVQAEHPDKGGDAEQFAEYVEAYQVLKKRFAK